MKLFDLLTSGKSDDKSEQPKSFGEALALSFAILCHDDKAVAAEIAACIADTKAYCEKQADAYDERGLEYDEEAVPWLQLIAAVNAAEEADYLCELDWKEEADEFRAALEEILAAHQIEFSLERLDFDENKNIPDWAEQFNQYAGQSGITVYYIDIDSDSYVIGAARIADYARAAEIASSVGIKISSRFE